MTEPAADRIVLLLRGINVGGHRKLPMADLRLLCSQIGLFDVHTYVASGNVVAASPLSPERAAALLERSIEAHCGFRADVIARGAIDWSRYLDDLPLPDVAKLEPNRVMLLLANRSPAPETVQMLQTLAGAGEHVSVRRDGLWIYFSAAVGRTRLTPANIDKAVGAPTTARNWRTVQAIADLVRP